tara:strand:- start:48 stop:326 length:279 start_codon:yes stop_codon:yes gene_type:complete
MLVNVSNPEEWRDIPTKGLVGLYQMSTTGRLRTVPYSRFEGKELVNVESARVRTRDDESYLNKCNHWGWFSIANLYFDTFGVTKQDVRNNNI